MAGNDLGLGPFPISVSVFEIYMNFLEAYNTKLYNQEGRN